MTIAMNSRAREAQKAYVQPAGLAKQAIEAIKLVHAYSNEYKELKNYVRRLQGTQKVQKRQVVLSSLAMGFIYFLLYLFYALALYFGCQFRTKDVSSLNGGFAYSGGQVICIMGCIMLGSFDLGSAISHIRQLRECRTCGQNMIAVTLQMSEVKYEAVDLTEAVTEGKVEFKNVSFNYPKAKDKKIIRKFSHIFEANKTTAIFGDKAGKSTLIHLIERNYDP